jgi:hypothetical protein
MAKPPGIKGGTTAENELFQRFYLEIQHLPSRETVYFKAMLTQFEDQYTSDWTTEQVFGRMDPVRTFRGTQRIVSLGWDVVAASLDEARHNLKNCSELLSMLYPSYSGGKIEPSNVNAAAATQNGAATDKDIEGKKGKILKDKGTAISTSGNAATIASAPLFRIKFANLVQSTATAGVQNDSIESGLIGSIDGLTYAPDLEQGFFDPRSEGSALYPQTIKLAFGFTVAHDHPLGWTSQPMGKTEDAEGKPVDPKNATLRNGGKPFPYPSGGNE